MSKVQYKRKVYKDIIRDAIYDAIIAEELKPGDRIIEMEWAEAFGSSQAPVREAIRDLEALGVVESAPFKGATVRVIGKDELEEIHTIRAGLEAAALTEVIKDISEEGIHELRIILDDMMKAARAEDINAFMDKDIAFHETIVDKAEMPYLRKMWDMCNIRLWTTFGTKYSKKGLIELAENHEAIFEKIEARDPSGLFETIRSHFNIVSDAMGKE